MNYKYPQMIMPYNDTRVGGFLVPFLLGGLGGSAIVGLSRPRPVYVTPPYQGGYGIPNYGYPGYPYPY